MNLQTYTVAWRGIARYKKTPCRYNNYVMANPMEFVIISTARIDIVCVNS